MITFITGGERSGKSTFAEALLKDKNVCYIATAYYDKEDREMVERIKKHKEQRPNSWRTYEGYRDLIKAIGTEDYYLLECITNLVSRIMYELSFQKELDEKMISLIENEVINEMEAFIHSIKSEDKNLIMVSNEIGMTMVSMHKMGRAFTDILGRVNQRVAYLSDSAYFVVSGIPMRLK